MTPTSTKTTNLRIPSPKTSTPTSRISRALSWIASFRIISVPIKLLTRAYDIIRSFLWRYPPAQQWDFFASHKQKDLSGSFRITSQAHEMPTRQLAFEPQKLLIAGLESGWQHINVQLQHLSLHAESRQLQILMQQFKEAPQPVDIATQITSLLQDITKSTTSSSVEAKRLLQMIDQTLTLSSLLSDLNSLREWTSNLDLTLQQSKHLDSALQTTPLHHSLNVLELSDDTLTEPEDIPVKILKTIQRDTHIAHAAYCKTHISMCQFHAMSFCASYLKQIYDIDNYKDQDRVNECDTIITSAQKSIVGLSKRDIQEFRTFRLHEAREAMLTHFLLPNVNINRFAILKQLTECTLNAFDIDLNTNDPGAMADAVADDFHTWLLSLTEKISSSISVSMPQGYRQTMIQTLKNLETNFKISPKDLEHPMQQILNELKNKT